jgi:pimeloyl-ACP methyl ester carboxylesterase
VQAKVAARTRACVYDRAGLGFSDPSPQPPTLGHVVDDLHALLGKAGIAPPYVLVGNSFGGAGVQLYAYRYPQEVKRLVLVEAGHEDEAARMNTASQGKLKQIFGDRPLVVLARGVSPYAIPAKPQSALNKAVEAENLAIQKETAALSTRSSLHVVAGAGHIIQADKPQAVVDAVGEALDRAGY